MFLLYVVQWICLYIHYSLQDTVIDVCGSDVSHQETGATLSGGNPIVFRLRSQQLQNVLCTCKVTAVSSQALSIMPSITFAPEAHNDLFHYRCVHNVICRYFIISTTHSDSRGEEAGLFYGRNEQVENDFHISYGSGLNNIHHMHVIFSFTQLPNIGTRTLADITLDAVGSGDTEVVIACRPLVESFTPPTESPISLSTTNITLLEVTTTLLPADYSKYTTVTLPNTIESTQSQGNGIGNGSQSTIHTSTPSFTSEITTPKATELTSTSLSSVPNMQFTTIESNAYTTIQNDTNLLQSSTQSVTTNLFITQPTPNASQPTSDLFTGSTSTASPLGSVSRPTNVSHTTNKEQTSEGIASLTEIQQSPDSSDLTSTRPDDSPPQATTDTSNNNPGDEVKRLTVKVKSSGTIEGKNFIYLSIGFAVLGAILFGILIMFIATCFIQIREKCRPKNTDIWQDDFSEVESTRF